MLILFRCPTLSQLGIAELLYPRSYLYEMEDSEGTPSIGLVDQSKRILELMDRIEALEVENERLRNSGQRSCAHVDLIHPSSSSNSVQKLSNAEIERYSRQLLLSNGFGVDGQRKLLDSSVCIIGAGGIGSTGRCIISRQV